MDWTPEEWTYIQKVLKEEGVRWTLSGLNEELLRAKELKGPLNEDCVRSALGKLGLVRPEIAAAMFRVGDSLRNSDSLEYFTEALEIYKLLYPYESIEISECLFRIGEVYYGQKELKKALECHEEALVIRKRIFSEDSLQVAESTFQVGTLLKAQKNYDEAIEYYESALEIRKKHLESGHRDIADVLCGLAVAYSCKGELSISLKYHFEVLELRRASFELSELPGNCKKLEFFHMGYSPAYIKLAESLESIGTIHYEQGRYTDAISYLEESLHYYTKVVPKNQNLVFLSLCNLGNAYFHQENYKKSSDCYQTAYDLGKTIHGVDGIETTQVLYNIGLTYEKQDKTAGAIYFYNEVLKSQKKTLAENDPALAVTLNRLGLVYYIIKDYEQSLLYHKAALAVRRHLPSHTNVDTAESLYNIAAVYSLQNNIEESLKYHHESLGIRKDIFPIVSLPISDSLAAIGYAYYQQNSLDNAYNFQIAALSMRRELLNHNDSRVADSLFNLGSILNHQGSIRDSVAFYLEALETGTFSAAKVATTYANIGLAYLKSGDLIKALHNAHNSLELRQTLDPPEPLLVADSLYILGLMYFQQKDMDKSINYHVQALHIRSRHLPEDSAAIKSSYKYINMIQNNI